MGLNFKCFGAWETEVNPQDLETDLGAEMRLFDDVGFLADDLGVGEIRSENADWFVLAEDLNAALMALTKSAMNTVRTTSWDPKAVAVRLLLRCCSNLQGIILLTERGMAPEARTLVRSLLEGAFGLAALLNKPAEERLRSQPKEASNVPDQTELGAPGDRPA